MAQWLRLYTPNAGGTGSLRVWGTKILHAAQQGPEQKSVLLPLDHEIFAPCFMSLDMFQCLLVDSLWELEQNLYLTVV